MSIAFAEIFLHRPAGHANCRRRVRPNGRLLFLHRLSGGRELPQAGSPLTGGVFFAEPQRGVALCGARETAAPAAGAKRKGHLRFPFLFGLLPFPCFLIWRRFPICDRFDMGNGRGFFLPCFSQPIRNVRYRSATHAVSSPQARHKVNCPKGKRGSPGGCLCRATRLRVVADGTCEL